jgi:mannose-6-phosphate isomerase-like protein (cupin superfamily)
MDSRLIRRLDMHFRTTMLAVLGAVAFVPSAFAQTTPAAQAPVRTVIAQAKLPSVVDKPMNFRVVRVELKAGQKETLSSVPSIVYQVSGSAEVSIDGQTTPVAADTALYIPAGGAASLTAKGGASTSMVFQLSAAGTKAAESGAGSAKELYSTRAPLPGLKAGSYDINLTRVTFPAKMPANAPHHRTGGAVYYIVSGKGADTVGGKTYDRGPGVFIYEPAGLVHQWGNPGAEPLTFLAFNINPEGVPAVAQETPAGQQRQ